MKYIALKDYDETRLDKVIKMLDIVGIDYDIKDDDGHIENQQPVLTTEDEIALLKSAVFENIREMSKWMLSHDWIPVSSYYLYMKENYIATRHYNNSGVRVVITRYRKD